MTFSERLVQTQRTGSAKVDPVFRTMFKLFSIPQR
jgi:hypothetical protein